MSVLKVYQGATLLVSGSLAEAIAFDKTFTGAGNIEIVQLIDAAGPFNIDRTGASEDFTFSVWRLHDSALAALQFCAAHRALIANVATLKLVLFEEGTILTLTLAAAAWQVVRRKTTGLSSRIEYQCSGGPWAVAVITDALTDELGNYLTDELGNFLTE